MENEQFTLFEEVRCKACRKPLPTLNAFETEKYINGVKTKIHFCNEAEANDYYLESLRKVGM